MEITEEEYNELIYIKRARAYRNKVTAESLIDKGLVSVSPGDTFTDSETSAIYTVTDSGNRAINNWKSNNSE